MFWIWDIKKEKLIKVIILSRYDLYGSPHLKFHLHTLHNQYKDKWQGIYLRAFIFLVNEKIVTALSNRTTQIPKFKIYFSSRVLNVSLESWKQLWELIVCVNLTGSSSFWIGVQAWIFGLFVKHTLKGSAPISVGCDK